jgi:hypothetical protein
MKQSGGKRLASTLTEAARKLWGRTRHAEGRERISASHDQDVILPPGGKDAQEPGAIGAELFHTSTGIAMPSS